ncbi:D-alanyl-D-alanine dipeptidase [hydrothermal vent metagenome]|uniref:D-alanyl-D-alanine dipeptidase n=1 Tax=hydrothermal vent metagenome TaxID=652676 RepID=A0A1W1CQE4_9ZZZZ
MKKILWILLMCISVDAKDFLELKKEIPSIELDIRYYGSNNFIGKPIDGYLAPKAILTKEATLALKKVQKELKTFSLGLKIFDAYRPQKAVDHFVRWGKDLADIKMKEAFYPNVKKKNLFKEGYIAKYSGHSRGSTVDLTIIDLNSKTELDMGSSFDLFGKLSWIAYKNITAQQRANRMLLHIIMLKYGFKSYAQEWWHFTLKNEPYKEYFNFNIE